MSAASRVNATILALLATVAMLPSSASAAGDRGTPADCSVQIRWQTSAAEVQLWESKVRVRGLPWVPLGGRWGYLGGAAAERSYTGDAGNSLFYTNVELNQDCDRLRRYRIRLVGKEGTRFRGLTRDLYYPRENGFTTETNIDLGYLDLCMADGHECDGPYYPGGNATPFPPGDDARRAERRQALEESSDQASGVVVDGHSLAGDWVRTESNNHRNNGMRLTLDADGATLTVVPSTATRAWRSGQLLWRNLGSDGTLEVRGSDGVYYPSVLTVQGPDRVELEVSRDGRGDRQTWSRAGPSIEGDWVRVANGIDDGLRIRVDADAAVIRFLPANASRGLRTGGRIWRDISPSGSLEIRGSDGRYHAATASLIDADRLRIESDALSEGQLWVRPGAVDDVRADLEGPVDPDVRDPDLTPVQDLPSIDRPPATPPPGATRGACVATSLPADAMGVAWGFALSSPTNDDPREETLGIRELMIDDFAGPRRNTNVLADLERVRLPGFDDGWAFVWQANPSRRDQWEEHRDLTSAELEARNEAARNGGLRPIDLEAWSTSAGMRYGGVWVANAEGLGWWARHDMTSDEYGEAFTNLRASGYRLIDMEAYPTSGGVRYAAVWYQSCDNQNWRQLRGMDRDDYDMEVESRAERGFRVVDFESYTTSNGQRYAAIWERIPDGRAWAVRSDRTLGWFLNYHRRYVDEGLRLIDFESYDTPDGLRYGGVWAENDARYDAAYRVTLDTIIQNYRTTHGLPGISVVVMQDDSVLYRRGFGWADSAGAKWAHSGTVYLTASVAKVIGATIAARLEERGVLDLTRPTADFLEDLPDYHTHTVEQLLAKTGCVRHYAETTRRRPDTTQVYAFRLPAVEQLWADSMLSGCTPGRHYRYSTHGYTYAGAVLEEVTGMPIADIIADELTVPFALPSMRTVTTETWGGYGGLGVRPHHLAQGYVLRNGGSVPVDYENTTWKVLGGGLQTDAMDLARFGVLTLRGAIVADTARLWTPLTAGATAWNRRVSPLVATGLGWRLGMLRPARRTAMGPVNRAAAEHGGDGRGAGTLIRLYRDGGLVIAILANQQLSASSTNAAGNPIGHPIESLATAIATAILTGS